MRRLALCTALAVAPMALSVSPAVAQRRHHAGGPAAAGTQKAPAIRVTFGFAILNERALKGEVALVRMAPNTTYEIAVLESPAASVPFTPIVAGALTTDDVGNGHLAINVERMPGSTTFFVAAVPQGFGQSFGSSAAKLGYGAQVGKAREFAGKRSRGSIRSTRMNRRLRELSGNP